MKETARTVTVRDDRSWKDDFATTASVQKQIALLGDKMVLVSRSLLLSHLWLLFLNTKEGGANISLFDQFCGTRLKLPLRIP